MNAEQRSHKGGTGYLPCQKASYNLAAVDDKKYFLFNQCQFPSPRVFAIQCST